MILVIIVVFVFNTAVCLASFCTWIERKASAMIQDRIGANRAGSVLYTDWAIFKPLLAGLRWLGILGFINTLFCDPIKGLFKEDFIPEGTSPFIHALAPFLSVLPVFMAFAVVPLAPSFTLPFYDQPITVQAVSLNAAVLFVFAMGSLATYGILLAGWSANNKFSLLGALRAGAQMLSYELAMGVALVTMIVVFQTLDFYEMVEAQKSVWQWGIVKAPLAFIILFVAPRPIGSALPKKLPLKCSPTSSPPTVLKWKSEKWASARPAWQHQKPPHH